jgi:hypothetical protein
MLPEILIQNAERFIQELSDCYTFIERDLSLFFIPWNSIYKLSQLFSKILEADRKGRSGTFALLTEAVHSWLRLQF